MKKSQGKIIAVTGGPRSGKSFLAKLLTVHYKAVSFMEGEEHELPPRIIEDIQKNIRPMERILWFRNKVIQKYLKALEHKRSGQIVVLDTFWIDNQPYVELLQSGFPKDVIREMAEIDREILAWPDVSIFLKNSEQGIRKFISLGNRSFDASEDFINTQALPISKSYDVIFDKLTPEQSAKVIPIARENLDFTDKEQFKSLTDKIDQLLQT